MSTLVVACGSSGGEDSKSADQIVNDAKAALSSATSYHLVGKVVSGSDTVSFDMKVDDKNTASGTMSQGGISFDFVNAGGKLYFRGKDLFAKVSPAAAAIIGDQWVTVTGNASLEQAASGVTALSDPSQLAQQLGTSGGPYTKGSTKTVDGQQVVAITSSEGEMDVADSGTSYPVHFDGGAKGTIDITQYGQHFGITAPSNALDFGTLGQGAGSNGGSTGGSSSSTDTGTSTDTSSSST